MLKKITEPQAFYQKSNTMSDVSNTTSTTTTTTKSVSTGKKFNWKMISSILIVSIVTIAGIAGVLIAQRQQLVEGPVAPNAPSSKPAAAPDQNNCSVTFTVKPGTTTPVGTTNCISKTASKVVKDATNKESLQSLPANSKVNPGDIMEYSIAISATGTTDSIEVVDTLPAHLKYNPASGKINGVLASIPGGANNTITFRFASQVASSKPDKKAILSYRTTVLATAPLTDFTNTITLSNNAIAVTVPNSCKVTLGIQPPLPTGVAKCEGKVAYNITTPANIAAKKKYTTTGANVSTVKRGEIIEFEIKVTADKQTKGPVVVTDTLPNQLEYVPNSSTWKDTLPPTGTKTIAFSMGHMATDGKKQNVTIKYKAKVTANATIAAFTNTVKVVTNGEAATADNTCKATLKVAPVGVAQCAEKSVASSTGAVIAENTVVAKGDTISYKIRVTADQTTTGSVVVTDVLPTSVTYDSAVTTGITYNPTTRTVSADLGVMGSTADNKTKTIEFKVKINDNAPAGDFTNNASVTTAGANPNTCPATLRLAYACNVGCTTDDQCKSINSGYICSTENGSTCRLADNPSSASCGGLTPSYDCNSSCQNNTQCQTKNSNYVCAPTSEGDRCRHKDYTAQTSCEAPPTSSTPTPTPTIGCNALCVSNADCTNPAHICSTIANGEQRCRDQNYPDAQNCVAPGTPTTASQPVMPQELPQTGPQDWVNWLKAGLVTLGIGAVLLLLL